MGKVKKVASAAGVKRYGLPEGTPLDGSHIKRLPSKIKVPGAKKNAMPGSDKAPTKRTAKPYLKDAKARLEAANAVNEKPANKVKPAGESVEKKDATPDAPAAPEVDRKREQARAQAASEAKAATRTPEEIAAAEHKRMWMMDYGLDAEEYRQLLEAEAGVKVSKPETLSPEGQAFVENLQLGLQEMSSDKTFAQDMAKMYAAMPGFSTKNTDGTHNPDMPADIDGAVIRDVFKTALMKQGLTADESKAFLFAEVTSPGIHDSLPTPPDPEKPKKDFLANMEQTLDLKSATTIQGMVLRLREIDDTLGLSVVPPEVQAAGLKTTDLKMLYRKQLMAKGMTFQQATALFNDGTVPDIDPNSPAGIKLTRRFPHTGGDAHPLSNHVEMVAEWRKTQVEMAADKKMFEALSIYIGDGYKIINKKLRTAKGGQVDDFNGAVIAELDRAMQVKPTHKPVTTFRGLTPTAAFNPAKMAVGTTYTDHGYVSSTVGEDEFNDIADLIGHDYESAYTMELRVPAGTRATYLSGLKESTPDKIPPGPPAPEASFESEQELLLDRGTMFRVVSNDPYQRHMVVEVVGQRNL